MKDTFIVKLDPAEARWVERQALVFGSYSAVIRTTVRAVLALIAINKIRWDFSTLHELFLGNAGNTFQRSDQEAQAYAWKGICLNEQEAVYFMGMVFAQVARNCDATRSSRRENAA